MLLEQRHIKSNVIVLDILLVYFFLNAIGTPKMHSRLFIFTIVFCFLQKTSIAQSPQIQLNITNHKNWNLINTPSCGLVENYQNQDRIIGGRSAKIGQFPFMTLINVVSGETISQCGGALINKWYVLTAAHCFDSWITKNEISIFLGAKDLHSKCSAIVEKRGASQIMVHKDFDHVSHNDIALIRLSYPVQFTSFIKPICLPYGDLLQKVYDGQKMTVAGWGMNNKHKNTTNYDLTYISISLMNVEECGNRYWRQQHLQSSQICSTPLIEKDSCNGDSGGPLFKLQRVEDDDPRFFVFGVVSFGSIHCASGVPGIYTSVRHYLEWILNNIRP